MTALDTLCCELLTISLTQRNLPLSQEYADETWHALPTHAALNRIGALLFDAIPLLPQGTRVPRQVVMALALQAEECERNYNSRRAALHELELLMGQKPAVLKGFALASLYPNPKHRVATDIDLFCGEQTEALATTLQQHEIACDSKNPRHTTFVLHGTLFEAHRYLFYNTHDRNLFADWESKATDKLSLSQHALFFLAHTAYDAVFFDIAIQWRTCCDWLLLLRRLEATPAERAQFEQRIEGATFEHFAKAFTRSCYLRFPVLAEGLTLYNIKSSPTSQANLHKATDDTFHRHIFWKMFRDMRPRSTKAQTRVARRSGKYLRYNRYYKALFGHNMFRIFYLRNVWGALCGRAKNLLPPESARGPFNINPL